MTDRELHRQLLLLKEGDKTAFSEIYRELKTPVFTVLVRLTGDWQLSEDLLQEIFLKLYREPPQVEKPRAYVFRMARNLAIDALRQKKVSDRLEELDLPARPYDPGCRVDLERAFAQLSLSERQAVVLHLCGGLTFREVVEITEQPLGTVLWHYRKALGKLRNILEGESL